MFLSCPVDAAKRWLCQRRLCRSDTAAESGKLKQKQSELELKIEIPVILEVDKAQIVEVPSLFCRQHLLLLGEWPKK